jgi:hypothetical protein
MSDRRATLARAAAGYDEAHERALVEAIVEAIGQASMISDCNAMVLRTGECASALLTLLAAVLAMSPTVTRSPAATRRTMDELHRRLRRRLADAERDPTMQDFVRQCFNGTNVKGNA